MDFHCSNRAAQSKCFSRSFHPMFIDFNGRIPISEFRLGKEFRLSKKTLALFTYIIIIELDELKTYREPLYLMVKTMVSGSDFHLYIYIYTHIKQVPRRVFMHHGIMSISCSDSAYDALSLNFNITSRIMETL
jgi:hypothetical protein